MGILLTVIFFLFVFVKLTGATTNFRNINELLLLVILIFAIIVIAVLIVKAIKWVFKDKRRIAITVILELFCIFRIAYFNNRISNGEVNITEIQQEFNVTETQQTEEIVTIYEKEEKRVSLREYEEMRAEEEFKTVNEFLESNCLTDLRNLGYEAYTPAYDREKYSLDGIFYNDYYVYYCYVFTDKSAKRQITVTFSTDYEKYWQNKINDIYEFAEGQQQPYDYPKSVEIDGKSYDLFISDDIYSPYKMVLYYMPEKSYIMKVEGDCKVTEEMIEYFRGIKFYPTL